jgi:IS5 family transposase
MPACATEQMLPEIVSARNLFLPVPDTDFRDFLDEIENPAIFAPEIIGAIELDLDAHAREKKLVRLADRKYFESQTGDLPALDIKERNMLAEELQLAAGRPRMPGYAVYVFLMVRGFLGSLTSKPARRFLRESMSLYGFLQNRGLEMPGMTTILENVNLVSHATRELMFNKQVEFILRDELDDFKMLTIDSTSVKANVCWPTDAKILNGLLRRAYRLGGKFHVLGLKDFCERWIPSWLSEIDKLEFQICLVAGKAKSQGKLKKHYRRLIGLARKTVAALNLELRRVKIEVLTQKLPPSRQSFLRRMLDQIEGDLADANHVMEYAHDRVFHDKTLPSTEKILSLSDGSAAFIKKGNRNPVIGYKPQLVRSANGFVTSLIVPEGNAADAVELAPAIADAIKRTGVIAELVSTDDGYASANGRNALLGMGVMDVSISGAKGKKLIDPADWDSEEYRDARRNRSAVESLMFTIKDGFEFGELGRRGIVAVRDELLEKVLAYNCCRIIPAKQRREERSRKAA